MKAYFVINEKQYKKVIGVNPPQEFRPSVVITDIPFCDAISKDVRNGMLVFPIHDERPLSIDFDDNRPTVFNYGEYGSDGTLFHFIMRG